MYSPHQHEKVNLRGSAGEFLVLAVDDTREKADLVRLSGVPRLAENVPFADIRALRRLESEDLEPQEVRL
jgi:hypothetical protein